MDDRMVEDGLARESPRQLHGPHQPQSLPPHEPGAKRCIIERAQSKSRSVQLHGAARRCQVDGCTVNLFTHPNLKQYHRRNRICDEHQRCVRALVGGRFSRYCQQCHKCHLLEAFDGERRSCREMLTRRSLKHTAASAAWKGIAAAAGLGSHKRNAWQKAASVGTTAYAQAHDPPRQVLTAPMVTCHPFTPDAMQFKLVKGEERWSPGAPILLEPQGAFAPPYHVTVPVDALAGIAVPVQAGRAASGSEEALDRAGSGACAERWWSFTGCVGGIRGGPSSIELQQQELLSQPGQQAAAGSVVDRLSWQQQGGSLLQLKQRQLLLQQQRQLQLQQQHQHQHQHQLRAGEGEARPSLLSEASQLSSFSGLADDDGTASRGSGSWVSERHSPPMPQQPQQQPAFTRPGLGGLSVLAGSCALEDPGEIIRHQQSIFQMQRDLQAQLHQVRQQRAELQREQQLLQQERAPPHSVADLSRFISIVPAGGLVGPESMPGPSVARLMASGFLQSRAAEMWAGQQQPVKIIAAPVFPASMPMEQFLVFGPAGSMPEIHCFNEAPTSCNR